MTEIARYERGKEIPEVNGVTADVTWTPKADGSGMDMTIDRIDTPSTTVTGGTASRGVQLLQMAAEMDGLPPVAPTLEWRNIPTRKHEENGDVLLLMGMTSGWCMVRNTDEPADDPFVMSQAAWEALDDVKG
jgi:hypothetical protein